MILGSSVMNVSVYRMAAGIGTNVTGVQTAFIFYTLMMASLMITGPSAGPRGLGGRNEASAAVDGSGMFERGVGRFGAGGDFAG
jgi:hypothetical protein